LHSGAIVPLKLLLEGRPGSGKTTAAASLAAVLRAHGVGVHGFLTHEIRERGRRVGFEIEAIGGSRATLAHVDLPGPPRVGKYGVDLEAFEKIALPALGRPPRDGVVLIDELGKMELASAPFCDAVRQLLEGPVTLVATVHAFRHPFTDALKQRDDVERVQITRSNRDRLPEELADRLVRP
jgi:nucleoside-triphosphatase